MPKPDKSEKKPDWVYSEQEEVRDLKKHKSKWNKVDQGRAKLVKELGDYIKEKRESALRDPLKVEVNGAKPPILVLVCSGRIHSPCQVDKVIENDIMDVVRDRFDFLENKTKVVIDLRAVRDVYSYAFECNVFRWAGYLNLRAEKVVIVLPPDPVGQLLKIFSEKVKLPSMVPDLEFHCVTRSRDVGQFL